MLLLYPRPVPHALQASRGYCYFRTDCVIFALSVRTLERCTPYHGIGMRDLPKEKKTAVQMEFRDFILVGGGLFSLSEARFIPNYDRKEAPGGGQRCR